MIPNKLIFLVAIMFVCQSTASGQHINNWRKQQLTYETKVKVHKYFSWDSKIYDADNDFFGISMESVDYHEESIDFLNDLQFGCREICDDMNLSFQSDGTGFLDDYKSYYIICFGDEPVITAVIIREDIKKVYEISIYCYKTNVEEGIKILKSYRFKKNSVNN